MAEFNPINFEGSLRNIYRDALGAVISGERADVERYLVIMAHDSAEAVATNQPELLQELKNQAIALAEKSRVTVVKGQEAVVTGTIDLVFRVGTAALMAAL